MSNINDKIRQIAKETEPELIHIRRELHQYPELGIDLPKTHEIISRELHKIPGLKIREHAAGGYGLIAELKGKKEHGKNVLLRADIDALPLEEKVESTYKSRHDGRMHACGHDGHATWLIGAAKILAQLTDEFGGCIRFAFQPGEEVGLGADTMIEEDKVLEDPKMDMAFAAHGWPSVESGKIGIVRRYAFGCVGDFKVRIIGKKGHASWPEQTVDPIAAANEIYQHIPAILTRTVSGTEPKIMSVTYMQAGFGENVRYTISPEDATTLQENIVRTHSVAVGEPLDREQARAVMLMTILNDGKGHSGIRIGTLDLIRQMLNLDIYPWAPGEGSVGYLGVEGHFVMAYIGEGKIYDHGEPLPADQVLAKYGIERLKLSYKEGLSMLNGTITVTAMGLLALYESVITMQNVEIAGALCYEALRGTDRELDPRIHAAKKHDEQIAAASNLRRMLSGSEIGEKYRNSKVQDAYVMRSMAHIHGAAKKLISEAYEVIVNEMHSVSDNPEIFAEGEDDGVALMCGNFDGSFVGSHADMLAMAAAIAGNLVERGTDRMVNRNLNDGLPAFLVSNPGLNSGFMIPQYTAAGLMNEIKHLAVPATIDSIPTCAGQEDPVSMGYYASKKALMGVKKLQYVTAIEIYVALQAMDFLKPLEPSPVLGKLRDFIRKEVPFVDNDRYLYPDIAYITDRVRDCSLVDLVENEIGALEF